MKRTLISSRQGWEACRMFFIAVALMVVSTGVKAQTANAATTDSTLTIEEKLVALALEGPRYKGSEHKNKIDEYQLRKAKNAWLNLLSLSLNYNDQTFAKNQMATVVYPKYFFGFTIPLGIMFSNGIEVKAAREAVKASQTTQSQLSREIRREVLTKYAQWKAYGQLLGIQNKVVDDEEAAFRKAEKNFGEGSISIEAYNTASKNYNGELTKRLNLQLQQDMAKLEIEEMIGTTLESVINVYPAKM